MSPFSELVAHCICYDRTWQRMNNVIKGYVQNPATCYSSSVHIKNNNKKKNPHHSLSSVGLATNEEQAWVALARYKAYLPLYNIPFKLYTLHVFPFPLKLPPHAPGWGIKKKKKISWVLFFILTLFCKCTALPKQNKLNSSA